MRCGSENAVIIYMALDIYYCCYLTTGVTLTTATVGSAVAAVGAVTTRHFHGIHAREVGFVVDDALHEVVHGPTALHCGFLHVLDHF